MNDAETSVYTVLVTGANSGLGYSICARLIDEFLQTRPQSESIHLILTTRSRSKTDSTLSQLQTHLRNACRAAERRLPGASLLLQRRIELQGEQVDLCRLRDVRRLAEKLKLQSQLEDWKAKGRKIDVCIWNAGIGGWEGLNWPLAVWSVMTNWVEATTWPTYKLGSIGWVTKPQVAQKVKQDSEQNTAGDSKQDEEPPLAEVFSANVFGHFMLSHWLAPLLTVPGGSDEEKSSRIIWLSSLEAYGHTLHYQDDDIQALRNPMAYESSKRLTDTLVLTSELPSTSNLLSSFFSPSAESAPKPKMYVSHPGICATSIVPLPIIIYHAFLLSIYVARWLGSPWHTVSSYIGACAPVWLALASQAQLDDEEKDGTQKGKWGSAVDRAGNERVMRTEVEGWGWKGAPEDGRGKKGRYRGVVVTTKESREELEVLGAKMWAEMMGLAKEWEERLGRVEDEA
ncbi:3-ketosteroid reductase-like protein [Aulographum hederae CBS 113979]|uniref:3-ketosteroid reductase-like protein n=1 Tax=Aulographum hederae CBS 113979 TaxID=1176131 RepID=A0A6G1HFH3_9PEZI|nr:3-ketosteroid reductase-like protein [Aulographum hederae CBS 113979]